VNVAADDPLNLRAGPGTGHRVLARLDYGRCGIMVTAPCRGSWCQVEDGHYAGHAHRRYLAAVSPAIHCRAPRAGRVVPIRAWPSEGSRVLAPLEGGRCDIALLPYRTEGWQKIRQNGWEGWVRLFDLVYMDHDLPG
jgi:SH3-like domain-containing protein